MHKFKKNDSVHVFNADMERKTIYEGCARIVKPLDVADQYEVTFGCDKKKYRRFCYYGLDDKLPEDLQKLAG